jgi:hypothetical protein
MDNFEFMKSWGKNQKSNVFYRLCVGAENFCEDFARSRLVSGAAGGGTDHEGRRPAQKPRSPDET